ncbi:hypothetical protein MGWOODY_Mmi36 [hydrothermal vent metagenome]|uniref:Uncharacterized protein n=1 Tax=hydrothermal vent metagenome TaxID=652676 RepID=A0A160VFK6_9ZZZZ
MVVSLRFHYSQTKIYRIVLDNIPWCALDAVHGIYTYPTKV